MFWRGLGRCWLGVDAARGVKRGTYGIFVVVQVAVVLGVLNTNLGASLPLPKSDA